MQTISATNLRGNLFEILKRVQAGEKIIISHKRKEVACIMPLEKADWRKKVKEKPKLLVSPEEFIKPIEDIWDDYV